MKKISIFMALLCLSFLGKAQNQTLPELRLQQFGKAKFSSPIDIENAGDSRLFIVERAGKIWIIDSTGKKLTNPFLDISNEVLDNGDEEGLLGLVFDPHYSTNGFFYVNYITKNQHTQISRFKVNSNNANKANVSSETKVLNFMQPFDNHKGGCMKFGPDGYLYDGQGDGGSEKDPLNLGQNLQVFLGKMLRIDVSTLPYTIPSTNPFVGVKKSKDEIWAYGLRNPWRFSFDDLTGDLWIADVGQDNWEEVDFQPVNDTGGENYGWRCWEGDHAFDQSMCVNADEGKTFPIVEYPHDSGDCAVQGGFVYRGSQFPNMYGKYFDVDYCSGIFRTVFKDNGNWKQEVVYIGKTLNYVSFGEDKNKELYVAGLVDGRIYHVIDSSSLARTTGNLAGNISLYPNPNHGAFSVRWISQQNISCLVTVRNLIGQLVFSKTEQAVQGLNEWNINSTSLSKGSYLLQVQAPEGTLVQKFNVQ
jgi:glucose/arabinose dehydrogenase